MATKINTPVAETLPIEEAPATLRPRRERLQLSARNPIVPARFLWYLRCKNFADCAFALLLSIPALPIVLTSALIVKLTSRGPAFYSQMRVGLNGRTFRIIKLRTMIDNCESLTGPRWSMPGDPRVTPFGWFLRVSHLDELPQLLNVLLGQMSLIGPRPERPEFIPELEQSLPAYRQRLNVRPGVTGLAQVQLPPDTDLTSVRRKLAHDLYYIRHMTPLLDLKILVCTGFYALGVPFRMLSRILKVPSSSLIERQMRDVVVETPEPVRTRLAA